MLFGAGNWNQKLIEVNMIGIETDLVLDGFIDQSTIVESKQSCDGINEDDFGRVGRDYFSSCTS